MNWHASPQQYETLQNNKKLSMQAQQSKVKRCVVHFTNGWYLFTCSWVWSNVSAGSDKNNIIRQPPSLSCYVWSWVGLSLVVFWSVLLNLFALLATPKFKWQWLHRASKESRHVIQRPVEATFPVHVLSAEQNIMAPLTHVSPQGSKLGTLQPSGKF